MMKNVLYADTLKSLMTDENMTTQGSPIDIHNDRLKALTAAAASVPKL